MSTRDELRAILDLGDFLALTEWCVRPDALPGEAEIVLELVKAGIGVDDIPATVRVTRRLVEQQADHGLSKDAAQTVATIKTLGGIDSDAIMLIPSIVRKAIEWIHLRDWRAKQERPTGLAEFSRGFSYRDLHLIHDQVWAEEEDDQ